MAEEYIGRITGSVGGLYTVMTDAPTPTGQILSCRARGVFRHNHQKPLVGDIVTVELDESGEAGRAVICVIHPRKNSLIRPPIANLDYIFITMAAASPEPDTEMIDKLIAISEHNKIMPVIVIGKSELELRRAVELEAVYRLAGYDVFVVSCRSGEGICGIRDYVHQTLPGHIAAFAGASGVGKSSLMNLIFDELSLEISHISRKTERGRHTTRQVTLYPASGESETPGFIADTPGFSMLDFEHFDFFGKDDLAATFREFDAYLGNCRYTKCSHTKEDGCAVLEAVSEGKIALSRHGSYVNLYNILKSKPAWATKGK